MEEGSTESEESPIAMEEGSTGPKEYTYRRPEQVTKLNDEAGYVTIKNTEANIKAT